MTNEEFSQYQVGDTVIVREWDDMASKCEIIDDCIHITNNVWFSSPMRKYCGRALSIKSIDYYKVDDDNGEYEIQLNGMEGYDDWIFVPQMLERIDNEIDLSSEWEKMILGE